MEVKIRQSRTTDGKNFKWDLNSNKLAYFCYRSGEHVSNRKSIAEKLNVKLSSLNNRIQHFKSLTEESHDESSKPSVEVREIFSDFGSFSEAQCRKEIEKFLGDKFRGEVPTIEENEDSSEFEVEEVVALPFELAGFTSYWETQLKYQSYNMNEMPWNEFVKIVSMMNVKSRGMKIENRIIEKSGLITSKRAEQGDAWMTDGTGVEIKTSFITPLLGSKVSLTGIRLWEESVMFYLLLVVDIRNVKAEPKTFAMWVPKSKLDEMDRAGELGTPGMKKSAAIGNSNVPKSLTLNQVELAEWCGKYPLPAGIKFA